MCCSRRDFRRPSCPPRTTPSVESKEKNALPERKVSSKSLSSFLFFFFSFAAPSPASGKTESDARRTPRFPKTPSVPYYAAVRVCSSTRSSFPRSPRAAAAAAGPSPSSPPSRRRRKKRSREKNTLPGKLFSNVPRGRARVNLHHANASCQTRVRSDADVRAYMCCARFSLARALSPPQRCEMFSEKNNNEPLFVGKEERKKCSKFTFSKRDLDQDLVRFSGVFIPVNRKISQYQLLFQVYKGT